MRVALLPCLDRIQGVHKHVAGGSPEPAGNHGLEEKDSISIFSTRAAHLRVGRDRRKQRYFSYMCVGRATLIVVVLVVFHIMKDMRPPSTDDFQRQVKDGCDRMAERPSRKNGLRRVRFR